MSLDFKIPDDDKSIIEEAYNVRNIWVHNNGRKNQKLVEYLGLDTKDIGQLFTINETYLHKVTQCLSSIQKQFHKLVLKKFT